MSARVAGRWVVWALLGALYASLVVASNLSMPLGDPDLLPADKRTGVRVPLMTRAGPVGGSRSALIHTFEWNRSAERTPVVLLHGSPGGGANFEALAPVLSADGRRCVAPDLPGFGLSDGDLPDLGARARPAGRRQAALVPVPERARRRFAREPGADAVRGVAPLLEGDRRDARERGAAGVLGVGRVAQDDDVACALGREVGPDRKATGPVASRPKALPRDSFLTASIGTCRFSLVSLGSAATKLAWGT